MVRARGEAGKEALPARRGPEGLQPPLASWTPLECIERRPSWDRAAGSCPPRLASRAGLYPTTLLSGVWGVFGRESRCTGRPAGDDFRAEARDASLRPPEEYKARPPGPAQRSPAEEGGRRKPPASTTREGWPPCVSWVWRWLWRSRCR